MLNLVNLLKFDTDVQYTCGNGDFSFEGMFPQAVYIIVTIIKIGVPILLVVLGMIDLGKSVMAQKEDEIKKGQSIFIKRLIAAILVFLVVIVVQIVVRFIASDKNNEKANISSCLNCFINGKAEAKSKDDDASKGCYKYTEKKTTKTDKTATE